MTATFNGAVDAAAQALASVVVGVPLDQTFDTTGNEATYFRALYLRAMPDRQLLALQQAGQRAWTLDPLLHTAPEPALLRHRRREETVNHRKPGHLLAANSQIRCRQTVGARPPRSPQLAPDNVDSLSGGSPA